MVCRRRRPSSSWSWDSVVCVVCPAAFGLVVVPTIGVVGLVGCLSLLLTKSLSTESHFKPSCASVTHVVSFMTSLLSL